MDLDLAFVIPAILFTVVAICLTTWSLLKKKADASAAAAQKKKPEVGYADVVPPSRALGQQLRPEPDVSAQTEPPAPAEEIQDVPLKVSSVKMYYDYWSEAWISWLVNKTRKPL